MLVRSICSGLIQFRLFVGLLANAQRKINGGKSAPEEESDEDSDVELETAGIPTATGPTQATSEKDTAAADQIIELDDVREDKLNAFLNDPERTIKIFLSSYMRKQGLIWYVPYAMPFQIHAHIPLSGPIAI